MLEWLIVGGGVHGTVLSRFLTGRAGVRADRIVVLDPHEAPLADWDRRAGAVGMEFMRSPSVHHIDLESFSIRAFATACKERLEFADPYHRPHHAVFRRHCDWVVAQHRLDELRRTAMVRGLERTSAGWRVETTVGVLESRRVIVATGQAGRLARPEWASRSPEALRIEHVFDPSFRRDAIHPADDVVIVGAGISAAQLALALSKQPERTGTVTVLARRRVRTRQFDIEPGWLGPRYLRGFGQQPCLKKRRAAIVRARGVATIPPEIWRETRRAQHRGALRWSSSEVRHVCTGAGGRLALELDSSESLQAARVILASGFERTAPIPGWLAETAELMQLPVAPCGYPAVDPELQWAPGLHLTGGLAELALGPAARNIAGARMAASRLVPRARMGVAA